MPTRDSHPSAPMTTVDLRSSADGDLIVQWIEAPGHERRTVPAAQLRRLLDDMNAVHDAEQTRHTAGLRAAWLAASRGLTELLDGPERALVRRIDEAERMLRKAVEQRPNSGQIVDSLGWAFFRLGRFAEGVPLLAIAMTHVVATWIVRGICEITPCRCRAVRNET